MGKYELVILLDPGLPKADMDGIVETLEKKIKKNQKEKDDMGLLDLTTKIKGNERAYFLSYYIEAEETLLEDLRKSLKLEKGILRYSIFKLGKDEKFLNFADVNKKFEISEEEKKKERNEYAFHDLDTVSKRKK